MARFQYLIVLGACVLVTLPLEFVFDARVWRRPRRLAVALVPAFALFVAWDLWATATGTWDFDPRLHDRPRRCPAAWRSRSSCFFLVVPDLRAADPRVGAQRPGRRAAARWVRPAGQGPALMPIYPVARRRRRGRRGRARAARCSARALPPACLLGGDGDRLRVHGPGRRLADQAVGADRDLPRGRHQRRAAGVGHPRRGVRLRLRAAHARDPGVGPGRPTRRGRSDDRGAARRRRVRWPWKPSATRAPVGDARPRHGLAPQPPRPRTGPASSATTCSRCASRPSAWPCSPSPPSGPALAPLLWVGHRGDGLRAGLPVRARGVHPPAAARAAAPGRATSTGCATPTGSTTATGPSPTGCCCPSCRRLRRGPRAARRPRPLPGGRSTPSDAWRALDDRRSTRAARMRL